MEHKQFGRIELRMIRFCNSIVGIARLTNIKECVENVLTGLVNCVEIIYYQLISLVALRQVGGKVRDRTIK